MLANGWTGWGPALGYAPTIGNMNLFFPSNNALANAQYANNNRISELPGMRRYYVSDRDRNKLRALATWQATEALALQGAADYNQDHYPDAVYGLQDSHNWDINVDATYLLGTDVTATVFYTYEDFRNQSAGNTYTANSNVATITGGQPGAIGLSGNTCDTYTTLQQRNNNNKLDPCLNWFTDRLDKVHSVRAQPALEGSRRQAARRQRQRDRDARAVGQQRHRRQLGEQSRERSRRSADDHRRVLHSGHGAADRQHRHRRGVRQRHVSDRHAPVACMSCTPSCT